MTRKLGLSSEWISARFRDERSRLDLTLAQVGEICGVSRNSVSAWEKETSIPADALAKLFEHGFDPHYIVTGLRYENLQVREAYPEYFPPAGDGPSPVSAEEWKLLHDYRALSEVQREQARAIVQVLKAGLPIGSGNVAIGAGARQAGRNFIQGSTIIKGKK